MAKRFNSENILSLEGFTYVIEIYDADYSGSSHEFVCGPNGFDLSYDNSSGELFKAVNASRLEFDVIADDAQVEGLQQDLVTANEDRFTVKVTRDGSLFWYGKLVSDIGTFQDISRNSRPILKLVALDGLGLLDKLDYSNSDVPYTGTATLLEHIYIALGKLGTLDAFTTASDVALVTVVEWHEKDMANGAGDDPIDLTRVGHEAFYSVDSNGVVTYASCLDVVNNICEIFGARIYQSNGVWRIEQITERHNPSIAEIRYNNAGTYLSHASVNYTLNIDQATNAKIVGGEYTYFPPVREVNAIFNGEHWRNYIFGTWSNTSSNFSDSTFDLNPSAVSTLLINFNLSREYTFPANYQAVYAIFSIELRVGTNYLRRNIDDLSYTSINYGNAEWVSTISRYQFAYPYPTPGAGTMVHTAGVTINTPVVPDGGQVSFKVSFEGFRSMATGEFVYDGSMAWTANQPYVRHLYAGNFAEEFTVLKHVAKSTNGIQNSTKKDYNFRIGDRFAAGDINKLEIYDGTAWKTSSLWRDGVGSTSYTSLIDLLCKQVLIASQLPVEKWSGTIKGTFDARTRLGWSSAHYIFLGGSLTARTDEWSGTWVIINRDSADIVVEAPEPIGININDGKNPFNPVQTPSSFADPANNTSEYNTGGVIGQVMSAVTTSNSIVKGAVTTIALNNPVNEGVFQEGEYVTIVNPFTGASHNLTVTTTNVQGATSIAVAGYLPTDMPSDSYVMQSPQNWTLAQPGGTALPSATVDNSTWWDVYEQRWEIDNTNAEQWPIEGYDTVLETNINAGDGSTAGIRFDGDGLQAYNASYTYPRLAVSTDGKLRVVQSAHPTPQVGLVYNLGGILYNANNEETLGMLPQFGHAKQFTVFGYDVDWTAGYRDLFYSFSADYSTYEIYKIYWRLTDPGTAGNKCYIQLEDTSAGFTTIGTITTSAAVLSGTIYPSNGEIATSDALRFNIDTITGTAPKSLFIEIYLQVA
jgi:hypothetical protein